MTKNLKSMGLTPFWANSVTNGEDRGYLYDAAWNLTTRTNNGSTEAFTVDNKNQLTNAPTSVPGNTMDYDDNGNLVSSDAGFYLYEYDDENQLTAVEFVEDTRLEFTYDGKGRLKQYVAYAWDGSEWLSYGAQNYIYDGMRVIQDRDSNTPFVSYTRGNDLSGSLEGAGGIGGMLARSHSYSAGSFSSHNFYHADGNGNITHLINGSQSMVASYRYDPFGNELYNVGSLGNENSYRFSSKPTLWQNLYYYGFRWYAANAQRWMNRDPLGEVGFEISYPIRQPEMPLESQVVLWWSSGTYFGRPSVKFAELLPEGPNLDAFVGNAPTWHVDLDGLSVPYYPPGPPDAPSPIPQCVKDCAKQCGKAHLPMRGVCALGCIAAGPAYLSCFLPCNAAVSASQALCTLICSLSHK